MIVLLQAENRNIEMIATVAGNKQKKKKKNGYLIVRDEKLSTTTPVIKVLCS
jgi:hypothetical protein